MENSEGCVMGCYMNKCGSCFILQAENEGLQIANGL